MKQIFRFDSDGFYVEPIILQDDEQVPEDCTEDQPEDGLFKAKFVDGRWVESLTEDQINEIKNAPQPKTELDLLKEKQNLIQQALDDLILGGAL